MRTTMATENNNKTLNVPNLRFPEFSGEWTKTLLNNYLEENKERNKRGIFTKNHVLSVSGDFGIVNQIELLGRSFAGKSVLDYHVVRTGNIVYTKSPLKEYPYGIVKVNGGVDGIVSTLYAVYKVKETANGKFVEYYFGLPNRTNRYFKPIVRIGAKHDMKIGNDEVLANYVVFPCVDEQKRISDFICLLDERIATQIKIIEKLESLIKGLYERLFNIDGAAYIQLGNVAKIQKGQQINGEELSEIGSYYVMNGGVVPSGYLEDFNTPANTISISEGGNSCGYVQYNGVPFWSGGHCYTLIEPINSFNYKYLFHYLKFKEQSIMALRIGSGLPNIQKKDLERFPILNVSKEEQDKMACIFDDILDRIICERQIALKYEEQKRYLLSNLFI